MNSLLKLINKITLKDKQQPLTKNQSAEEFKNISQPVAAINTASKLDKKKETEVEDLIKITGTSIKKIVYHGTPYKFDEFQNSKAYQIEDFRHLFVGFHFASKESTAQQAATNEMQEAFLEGNLDPAKDSKIIKEFFKERVISAVLDIKNPLRTTGMGFNYNWDRTIQQAKRDGFDGIIYNNKHEGNEESYIAFDKNQIHVLNIKNNMEQKTASNTKELHEAQPEKIQERINTFKPSEHKTNTDTETFKMPPHAKIMMENTTDETFRHIASEIGKGNDWLAYNLNSFVLNKQDMYFFKNQDEAREFSKNNISEWDSFRAIKVTSVADVLKQIPVSEMRFEFSATLNKGIPDNIAGHKLNDIEKNVLLTDGLLENLGGFVSGKTLSLVEDPKTKELSIKLTQLVFGKDPEDIFEVSRLIHKRDISSAPYIESSGLKNELQKSGIDAPLILKEPLLINVLPTETKELEKKSSIAESRGQKYAVISHSSTDNISFHTSLKEAADLATYNWGSLVKTKDLKESLSYQKEGGDINITTNDNTPGLKKDRNMRISW
jgi:hypothetical protein